MAQNRTKPSVVRVAMAKRVAAKWLEERVRPEYRIAVLDISFGVRNLPSYLKAFRDGRARIANVDRIADLGIDVKGPRMDLWSTDREGIVALEKWLSKTGCDTTGIW
jgi:hypothetical protein